MLVASIEDLEEFSRSRSPPAISIPACEVFLQRLLPWESSGEFNLQSFPLSPPPPPGRALDWRPCSLPSQDIAP